MKSRSIALSLFAVTITSAPVAWADKLPAIKTVGGNAVPACATPGRLMTMTRERNPNLDDRFAGIATEYMRHGEALGLRWDYAYFQMLLETGNLSFKRGNGRDGSVKPSQNNFAGLGATGKGEPGESFPSVSIGVRAHLEHLLIYAGERVESPVAERTRKVQEWGILQSWQKRIKGPVTYTDLLGKWAVGDKGYAREIGEIGEAFMDGPCRKPDPNPDLVAAARARTSVAAVTAPPAAKPRPTADDAPAKGAGEKISGAELARRAVEEARAEGNGRRSALGAGSLAATGPVKSAPVEVINGAKDGEIEDPDKPAGGAASTGVTERAVAAGTAKPGDARKGAKTVAAAGAATAVPTKPSPPPAAAPGAAGCKVFQASYGGLKAIIIKAAGPEGPSYTVLDVNEGNEKREAEAYIQAYAKGGETVGEYANQAQALDKAFELCPEG